MFRGNGKVAASGSMAEKEGGNGNLLVSASGDLKRGESLALGSPFGGIYKKLANMAKPVSQVEPNCSLSHE